MTMTPKEVALACNVTYHTVLRWIRDHGLPAKRRGIRGSGMLELEPAAVKRWCNDNDVQIHNPFHARSA